MTAVVMTRSPLQTLTMTTTQRTTRRRTAVHAFDDENDSAHPIAKKAKVEVGKQTSGRVNGATTRRAQPSYDEDDDGFHFSRAKAKKAKAKTPPPEPVSIAEPVSNEAKAFPAKKRRKKYSFSESKETETTRTTRRSARLSGDKEQLEPPVTQQKQAIESGGPTKDEANDTAQNRAELHTPKTREPKKIALPFADTPIIKRNKEMRKKTSESAHRRSSTGMRGRRASSLIEGGTSNGGQTSLMSKDIVLDGICVDFEIDPDIREQTPISIQPHQANSLENLQANTIVFAPLAVPHIDVEPHDFFKHIEQSLPEPRRMKQLLTWCGTRALPERQNGDAGDGGALLAARHIEEEILKDIANKPEMSDWFTREELAPAVLVKRENPRNVQMALKLTELEQDIKRLQDERDQWEGLLAESTKPTTQDGLQQPTQTPPQDGERRPKLRQQPVQVLESASGIDVSLLDPSQVAIYATLQQTKAADPSAAGNTPSSNDLSQRISQLAAQLEPAIDIFADGVHKVLQYRQAADRVADRVLSSAADGLERRSRDTQKQIATERGVPGSGARDVKDVLHALAGVLNGE